jgi:hypothetical protein
VPGETQTPGVRITAFPTPPPAVPGAFTVYLLPTEQVCPKSIRVRTVEETYTYAHVRLDGLLARLEGNFEWLDDRDFRSDLRSIRREIEGLEVQPCTVYGHGMLLLEVEALETAFDSYAGNPGEAALALANARTASTTYLMWVIGVQPWRAVPLH